MAVGQLLNQDAILKENYGDIHRVLNVTTPIINLLPMSPKRATGRRIRELIAHRIPTSVGSYGPSLATLPEPQTSKNTETIIQNTFRFGSIGLDWVLINSSEADSYISAEEQEITGFMKYENEDAERCAIGDGSARLGFDQTTVLSGTAAALRGRIDVTSSTPFTFTQQGVENYAFYREGMALEVWYDPTGTAAAPSAFNTWEKRDTPSQGFYTANTIALDNVNDLVTVTCAENAPGAGNDPGAAEATPVWDVVAKDGAIEANISSGGNNVGNEMNGLDILIADTNAILQTNAIPANLLNDATFQGINASTNAFWQAPMVNGANSYLSLDLLNDLGDQLGARSVDGAEGLKFLVTSYFQARKYALSLQPQQRYPIVGAVGDFKSGYKNMMKRDMGVEISDIKMYKSRFCPKDRLFAVGGKILHYDLKPWGWADMGGGIWHPHPSRRPANLADAFAIKQIGVVDRLSSGKITGMKVS